MLHCTKFNKFTEKVGWSKLPVGKIHKTLNPILAPQANPYGSYLYVLTHLLRKIRVTCQMFSLKGASQFPFSRFSPSPNILQLQSLNSRFLSNILISSLRGQGHDRPLFKPWCGVVVTCDMDHALSSTTIVVACARNNFWRDQRPTPP